MRKYFSLYVLENEEWRRLEYVGTSEELAKEMKDRNLEYEILDSEPIEENGNAR